MTTQQSPRRSLRVRLALGLLVLGIGFALLMGVVAYRAASGPGVDDAARNALQWQMLGWGLGGVVFAGLLGIFMGRQIVDPITRLTARLP